MMPGQIEELVRILSRLPGLGRRSAQRAALALLKDADGLLVPLSAALAAAHESVECCERCGGFTVRGANPCARCTGPAPAGSAVCVVEDPSDIVKIDESGAFGGRYHVLGGKLSPARRAGAGRLRFRELKERIAEEGFGEVILAISTDMDGDATAGYIGEMLRDFPSRENPVRITRLAFGLPADSGISYSDPLTLRRAMERRFPAGSF